MTVSRVPGVYGSVTDGGLNTVGESAVGSRFLTGACSAGTVNAVVAVSDPDRVFGLFGSGPLARDVHTQVSAGGVVYAARAAATGGTVTADAANPVSPVVSTAGSPLDSYDLQVKITKAGAVGVSHFKYSLDGGDTWSLETLTVASYPVPNTSLSLTFDTGTYVLNDTYKFVSTAPTASVGAIQAAVRAFFRSTYQGEYFQICQASDAAMWAVADALTLEAEAQKRYLFALCETLAPEDDVDAWVTARLAEKAGFSSHRVVIVAAHAEQTDSMTGRVETRSLAARIGARISRNPVQRKAARVRDDALPGVVCVAPFTLDASGKRQTEMNHGHSLALEKAGFLTVYTPPAAQGVFVQEDRTAGLSTSDFALLPNYRVIAKARRLLDQAWLPFVQDEVDLADLSTSLESYITAGVTALESMRRDGELSDIAPRVTLKPGQTAASIIAASRVAFTARVVPKGYTREIVFDLGFMLPEGSA